MMGKYLVVYCDAGGIQNVYVVWAENEQNANKWALRQEGLVPDAIAFFKVYNLSEMNENWSFRV